MRSYFARHTERLQIRDEDLRRFWEEDKIAVHYPGDTERGPDLESLDPEDYSGTGKTAVRYVRDLERDGGYVWAESRVSPGVAKVGRVEPGTPVELDEALWEVDGFFAGRGSGDAAILKTVRLERGAVRLVGRTEQMGLRAGRPRQGTIVRWHCRTRLADLVEGRAPKEEWPNLSTEQAEAACAEFLRWQSERSDLPRLRYLLLPVGRTLKDVDVYGLAEDGRAVFAQVTYHPRGRKASDEKVEKLRAYGEGGGHLVFFGKGEGAATEGGVPFVSVEGEVLESIKFLGQPRSKRRGVWCREAIHLPECPYFFMLSCDGRSVMAREVEGPVWEYVKELLSDPELLKARYEEGRGDPAVDDEEEREKERIGRKLKALDREVGRLIDAYQAEVIDLPELRERRERIEEHGRMLKRRLSEIGANRAEREQEIRLLQGLEQFSESLRHSLEEPSFETKQQVLRLVVDRIVVEDTRVVVHHVVPTGPVRLQTERQAVMRGKLERNLT